MTYIRCPLLQSPIAHNCPIWYPRIDDLCGNLFYKKLEIGDTVYNPFSWDVGNVLSWCGREVKAYIISAFMFLYVLHNRSSDSSSANPIEPIWKIRDFIIYSQVTRNNSNIFTQVSPYSRDFSYPFELELYTPSKRPESKRGKMKYKKSRGYPSCAGAQQHNSDWPDIETDTELEA